MKVDSHNVENVMPCAYGPHLPTTGCVHCKLMEAQESLHFARQADQQQTRDYRKFQDAARKLAGFFDGLTAEQCAALPEGMADAWSEFEDAIPCRDCGAAPCGCPNV